MANITVAPPYANATALVTAAELWEILEIIARAREDDRKRIDALEKQLIAKGIGVPGTVRVDPVVEAFVRDSLWKTERDVDELKRAAMQYKGVYNADTSYARGSVVTRHGSWWIAEHGCEVGEMPGHSNSNWKLCVKRERAKS